MKIENVKEATVISNVPQEDKVEMSISLKGMIHLMGTLTNLYKDPELAVIREYYTNGLDAHAAAKITKPVEVKLPTWDDPSYIVRDFGIGMSKEDLKEIYSKYGESTKLDTNDELGAFGLGAKSGLTICTQFTVVSVKNGMKATALVSKSETGANTVNVISNVPTTEGNGTTVQIPVKSKMYEFVTKAHKFFAFSKPGTVLVDGRQPEYAFDKSQKIENPADPDMQIYVQPKSDGESYVLMGPVPYALSQAEIEASLGRLGVVANRGFVRMPKFFIVPIGSVHLTGAREGLRFSDQTNAVVDAHMSFLVNDLKKIAKTKIDEATSYEEFSELHKHWNSVISIDRKYKGEEVPFRFSVDEDIREISRASYGNSSHSVSQWFRLDVNYHRYLVKGFKADDYKKLNGYLTPYLTSLGKSEGDFMITDSVDVFDNKWVKFSEKITIIDGADIIEKGREQRKKDRLAASKAGGTAKKTKISYPILNVDEDSITWVEHPEIADDTPYLAISEAHGSVADLIRGTYRNIGHDRKIASQTANHFSLVTDAKEIILLNNSRTVKALLQRVPKTYSLVKEINAKVDDLKGLITPDLVRHNTVSTSSWRSFLVNSGINKMIQKIEDPNIVEILSPSKDITVDYQKYTDLRDALNFFRTSGMMPRPMIESEKDQQFIDALDEKYPLMDAINVWSLDGEASEHMVKYFNVIHKELVTQP